MRSRIDGGKNDCRGFTLVEIIVVLVILAILAAFTIPAMLGFVKDARNKAALANAREVYLAAQAGLTENQDTTTGRIKSEKVAEKTTTGVLGSMRRYLGSDIDYTKDAFNVYCNNGGDGKVYLLKYYSKASDTTVVLHINDGKESGATYVSGQHIGASLNDKTGLYE